MQHQLFPYVRGRLRKALVGRKFYWVAGFLTSLSLFLEEKVCTSFELSLHHGSSSLVAYPDVHLLE